MKLSEKKIVKQALEEIQQIYEYADQFENPVIAKIYHIAHYAAAPKCRKNHLAWGQFLEDKK